MNIPSVVEKHKLNLSLRYEDMHGMEIGQQVIHGKLRRNYDQGIDERAKPILFSLYVKSYCFVFFQYDTRNTPIQTEMPRIG